MTTNGTHPDFTVSIVAQATSTATSQDSFRALMASIGNGRWAEPVSAVRAAYANGGKDAASGPKKRLPGILFSGTFSQRSSSALTKHSGLICADVDEIGPQLDGIRDFVINDPHTLACFVSPSGTGLKVIFRCDPNRPHIESFHAAEQHMLRMFGLEIDQACKDVSRLCFVSHDPDAFVANDAEILPYPESKPREFKAPVVNAPSALGELSPGDDYDARGDICGLLSNHGWTKIGQHGWTRPGKTSGVSATWDKVPRRLYVFSDATDFEPNHVYRPWHVFAILECGGDFKRAAGELAKHGFGTKRSQRPMAMEAPPSVEACDLDVGPAPATGPVLRSPSSFALPPDNDTTILLGDRYLNRGDGAVLVGTSGIGKSSMEMQMAVTWALGRPCFGIKPNGPMRSLIIQSEDSDGDIAEMWTSMSVTMRLSQEDRELVNERVKIVNERVKRGREFTHELKKSIEAHNPDLVWINPLQAFMDGDVTDSQDLGQFLRGDLNKLNVPPRFAYMVVHHTTKPSTGKDRGERQWHEVMYDMAGGAEIINWARAIMSLRAAPTEGDFNLVLAKRGRRAGVVKMVPHGAGERAEPVTVIPLKHSTGRIEVPGVARGLPAIYWDTRAADAKLDPEEKKARGGRPVVYEFMDYKTVFPTKASNGMVLAELKRVLDANGTIDKRMLSTVLKRWEADGCIEVLRTIGHPMRYRCKV